MKYNVDVSRESEDWLATVTNLEGVSTWATTSPTLIATAGKPLL